MTRCAAGIVMTPTEAWGNTTKFRNGNWTSTHFAVSADKDPGEDVDFTWKAAVLSWRALCCADQYWAWSSEYQLAQRWVGWKSLQRHLAKFRDFQHRDESHPRLGECRASAQ